MKIFVITDRQSFEAGSLRDVYPGGDSAVLRAGEPLFFSGNASQWRCRVAPAYRVGRLGLHIPAKAAAAHLDGATLVHILKPSQPLMPTWAYADRTFSFGQWLSPQQQHDFGALMMPIGTESTTTDAKPFTGIDCAAAALSTLSQNITFKTGDVLVFDYAAVDIGEPLINNYISASVDNTRVLNFKIK